MKTTTTRLLSVLLCLAMIFVTIPHSILAQISETLNDTTDAEATETVAQDVYVLGEVIDNRTETSKTFRMSDGSFIAAVLNYSDREKTPHLQVKEGWTLSPIDNQSGTIRKCDAAFYEVKKS